MNTRTETFVDCAEWDKVVSQTYGRPYKFQQQNGCQQRGEFSLTVPSSDACDDEQHDSIPEVVNHDEMGVKLSAWLARDPTQPLVDGDRVCDEQWEIGLWWDRNFYPDIHAVANDLHSKGLLPAGDYIILIDW